MTNLVVYGSLIHPEECKKRRIDPHRATPVTVMGYRREFTQEPTWRRGTGDDRAVLNVVQSGPDSFNGILLCGIDDLLVEQLDQRESGYNRNRVEVELIHPYESQELSLVDTFVYIGKPEKRNEELLPNPEYLTLCMAGAREWGEQFHADFLDKTRVRDATLREFLANRNASNLTSG